MTKAEVKTFRKTLMYRQAELENRNSSRGGLAIQPSSDDLDRMLQGQERDFEITALDRNSRLLQEVRAALSRIDAATYGVCLNCENEISMKRLAAVPWTAFCIGCQTVADNAAGDLSETDIGLDSAA